MAVSSAHGLVDKAEGGVLSVVADEAEGGVFSVAANEAERGVDRTTTRHRGGQGCGEVLGGAAIEARY
jgi:hypothetical protein